MDRSADFNGIVLVILSFLSLNLGDLFSKLLVYFGAGERTRTPNPQIRSLSKP